MAIGDRAVRSVSDITQPHSNCCHSLRRAADCANKEEHALLKPVVGALEFHDERVELRAQFEIAAADSEVAAKMLEGERKRFPAEPEEPPVSP